MNKKRRSHWHKHHDVQRAFDTIEGQMKYWGAGTAVIPHYEAKIGLTCIKEFDAGAYGHYHLYTAIITDGWMHWVDYTARLTHEQVRQQLSTECNYLMMYYPNNRGVKKDTLPRIVDNEHLCTLKKLLCT